MGELLRPDKSPTPYGKVRGIQGDVDVNVFNGYKEQFAEFLQKENDNGKN